MDSNPEYKYLGKPLTKIIIVMKNIGFTASPYITTIKLENLR